MKITILTAGTRGDVCPYVAIALTLMERGHDVTLLGHQAQSSIAKTYGVPFEIGDTNKNPLIRTDVAHAIVTKKVGTSLRNKLHNICEYGRIVESNYTQYLATALRLTHDTDLILANANQSFFASVIAQHYGCKLGYLAYIPGPPTAHLPQFLWPARSLGPVTPIYNRLTHRLTIEGVWQLGHGLLNRVLAKNLGPGVRLPRWYPESDYCSGNRFLGGPTRGELTLYGYSPAFIPPPPDWPTNHQVTGYWFLEPLSSWHPPPELIEFLDSGSLPIYIGFGSMTYTKDDALVDVIKKVINASRERFIIGQGWSEISNEVFASFGNALVIDEVPFHWLFPRLKAAIHHGGAGTVAAALRAGIPSCVIPWMTDQLFWGQQVWAIGAGIHPVKREELDVASLRKIVADLCEKAELRATAQAIGRQISKEDGIKTAMHQLESAGLLPVAHLEQHSTIVRR